jgi:hypothetical protein
LPEALRIKATLTAKEKAYYNYEEIYPLPSVLHADCQFYMPGFWYRRNLRSPKEAPSFYTSDSWQVRKDRLSTPLTGIYCEKTGDYYTVLRLEKSKGEARFAAFSSVIQSSMLQLMPVKGRMYNIGKTGYCQINILREKGPLILAPAPDAAVHIDKVRQRAGMSKLADSQAGIDELKQRDEDFGNFAVGKHSRLPIPQIEVDNSLGGLTQNPSCQAVRGSYANKSTRPGGRVHQPLTILTHFQQDKPMKTYPFP